MGEIFAFLTLRLKLDPRWVLYEMTDYEMRQLMKYADFAIDKDNLELLRLNAYCTAQANSTTKLTLKDITEFPWEVKQEAQQVSQEDINRLRKKAQDWKQSHGNSTD